MTEPVLTIPAFIFPPRRLFDPVRQLTVEGVDWQYSRELGWHPPHTGRPRT
jgi:hypothetical protein